jgi:hypothetical protein
VRQKTLYFLVILFLLLSPQKVIIVDKPTFSGQETLAYKSLVDRAEYPSTKPSETVMICYNASLAIYAKFVENEVKSRFHNPVIVLGHGHINPNGDWLLVPDNEFDGPWLIEDLAWRYNKLYKDSDIVFWVCNPAGATINVPRVWYFRSTAWVVPDKAMPEKETRENEPGYMYAGSVWELQLQNNWH